MKILTSHQLRALDELTVREQNIESHQLMERATAAFVRAFTGVFPQRNRPIVLVCGTGNNGGDGFVAARLLHQKGYRVQVIACKVGERSADNERQYGVARRLDFSVDELQAGDPFFVPDPDVVLIDALFGTGLTRPIADYWGRLVTHLNGSERIFTVALDVPSGLRTDAPSTGPVVEADVTLTLGYPKPALFAPENTSSVGELRIVPFELSSPAAVARLRAGGPALPDHLLEADELARLVKKRSANDHKGTFGHALLVAGSFGKMGAAVIAARAILRTGAGLVTCHVPRSGYEIMQISFPEAMCTVDAHRYHPTELGDLSSYRTVAIGPGIGTKQLTAKALRDVLTRFARPMVIDADALNLIAREPELMALVPDGSILTPHPKEFERLFGPTDHSFQRWQLLREKAGQYGLTILLKTGYTTIATADGRLYVNPTGNPGMGTAGTGDALTGVITGLLAQGYLPENAAKLGVYLHGLAGDLAAEALSQQHLLAEDVVAHIGGAYRKLAEGI